MPKRSSWLVPSSVRELAARRASMSMSTFAAWRDITSAASVGVILRAER